MEKPIRVLILCAHPVQYSAPVFRLFSEHPRLNIQVAYCNFPKGGAHRDPDFGVDVRWDTPLLEGYPWISIPNRSPFPGADSFFGVLNPDVWRLVRSGTFDAVVLYIGYLSATFWIAAAAAKKSHVPILFGTDAHDLAPRDRKQWKLWLKRWLWPRLFGLADVVTVPSTGSAALMRSLGIPQDRVIINPYCVNNDWWIEQSDRVDRAVVRSRWNVPESAAVVLFCAKLQPWKRPWDVLAAFAAAADRDAYLAFAGDGALRPALESTARSLGIADRVRFLGFVNQTGLPETYRSSDILVLPSEYEPFGVVVNEAMLCRCPVIVSDRVGARYDLVREGKTGYVFPCGDVQALAGVLRRALNDRVHLQKMGQAGRQRMAEWSPAQNMAAFVESVSKAAKIRNETTVGAIR